jgi:hypothetical protein
MFKVSKKLQPCAFGESTSSPSLPKWPNLSWFHQHIVTKHISNAICTFTRTLISTFKRFWSICRKNQCRFWRFKQKTHVNKQVAIILLKIMFNLNVFIYIQSIGVKHLIKWNNIHKSILNFDSASMWRTYYLSCQILQ